MGNLSRSLDHWQMRPSRAPFEDESLEGYIAARTAAEGLPTTFLVTSLADVKHMHRPELTLGELDLAKVADCLRIDHDDLQARTYPLLSDQKSRSFFAAPISRFALDLRVRRFSPTALLQANYHRAIWSIRALPFCPQTGEMLLDRCPACNEVQKWHHCNGIDRCDFCAWALTDAQPTLVPPPLLGRLRLAAALIDPVPAHRAAAIAALPPEIQVLGPGPAFDLLTVLAGVVEPTIRMRGRIGFKPDSTPSAICAAMAEAWDLLAGWPGNFEEFAASRISTRKSRFGDGNQGATMDMLDLADGSRAQTSITPTISAMRERLTLNRQTAFDVEEAATAIGVTAKRILALRRAGALKTVFHIDRLPQPLILRSDVERLAVQAQSSVAASAAASALGITNHGLEQLVALGRLSAVAPWRTGSDNDLMICQSSLDTFIASLSDSPPPPEGVEMTKLSQALDGMPGLKAWGPVLDALSRRIFPSYTGDGDEPMVNRMMVRTADLVKLRAMTFSRQDYPDFSFDKLMSKQDAASTLDLHFRHSIPLLAKWPSRRTHEKTVPVASVERLADQFVSPAELAHRLQVTPRKAVSLADRAGLERTSPAGFNRADVDLLFG